MMTVYFNAISFRRASARTMVIIDIYILFRLTGASGLLFIYLLDKQLLHSALAAKAAAGHSTAASLI
jgi:hypothetical protein